MSAPETDAKHSKEPTPRPPDSPPPPPPHSITVRASSSRSIHSTRAPTVSKWIEAEEADSEDGENENATDREVEAFVPSRHHSRHRQQLQATPPRRGFLKKCCGINCFGVTCRITEWKAFCCCMFTVLFIIVLSLIIRTYTHPIATWKMDADTSRYLCVQRFNDTCLPWSNVTDSITVVVGFDWWWLRA